jgi:hypothetical protein
MYKIKRRLKNLKLKYHKNVKWALTFLSGFFYNYGRYHETAAEHNRPRQVIYKRKRCIYAYTTLYPSADLSILQRDDL